MNPTAPSTNGQQQYEIRIMPIEKLRRDGGTQPRQCLDPDVVAEYGELLAEGKEFRDPVEAFFDGENFWLVDGYHRCEAYDAREILRAPVKIFMGSLRDAILYSCGVNSVHGLRRSDSDKRRAVLTLLNDPEWQQWSSKEIARRCRVGHSHVCRIRNEQQALGNKVFHGEGEGTIKYVHKGKVCVRSARQPRERIAKKRAANDNRVPVQCPRCGWSGSVKPDLRDRRTVKN
jgi:hypothetical protein